jgi:hypothetical protein
MTQVEGAGIKINEIKGSIVYGDIAISHILLSHNKILCR